MTNTFALLLADEGVGMVPLIIMLVITVLIIVGAWKMFAKAGQPGWGIFVPIYGQVCICRIAGKPDWWVILFFIPVVNIIVIFIVFLEIAKNFGKGAGFGLGLIFLGFIFVPILGFGSAVYQGATASEGESM